MKTIFRNLTKSFYALTNDLSENALGAKVVPCESIVPPHGFKVISSVSKTLFTVKSKPDPLFSHKMLVRDINLLENLVDADATAEYASSSTGAGYTDIFTLKATASVNAIRANVYVDSTSPNSSVGILNY